MVSVARLRTLYQQTAEVFEKNIPGALVECGVWRGGCVGLMGLAAQRFGLARPIHLFDSFEGLPAPQIQNDGQCAVEYAKGRSDGALTPIGECIAGDSEVRAFLFEQLRLNPGHFVFHKGWFQDTVAPASLAIGPIALLRLDGDWYESTKVCLDHLYDQVSPGGFVILDDYLSWEGCKRATDEFLASRRLQVELHQIDQAAVYFRRP